jgi:hypothetical protein
MEELFSTHLPDGERPDLQFCIFPHLKEFLVIDQREHPPRIVLLDAADIFVEDFVGPSKSSSPRPSERKPSFLSPT